MNRNMQSTFYNQKIPKNVRLFKWCRDFMDNEVVELFMKTLDMPPFSMERSTGFRTLSSITNLFKNLPKNVIWT